MIKFKNQQGEFEFQRVEDLKKFLLGPDLTDHDVNQFGYLIANVKDASAMAAYCAQGIRAIADLRDKGMEWAVERVKRGRP